VSWPHADTAPVPARPRLRGGRRRGGAHPRWACWPGCTPSTCPGRRRWVGGRAGACTGRRSSVYVATALLVARVQRWSPWAPRRAVHQVLAARQPRVPTIAGLPHTTPTATRGRLRRRCSPPLPATT